MRLTIVDVRVGDAKRYVSEVTMPHGGNFNPEWGYLAPKPGFIRSIRMVLLAGGIGTVAGMAVAVALVARPAPQMSVAARTMAQPSVSDALPKSASAPAFDAEVLQNSTPHAAQPEQLATHSIVGPGDLKDLAAAESRSATTIQQPPGVAALAEAPALADDAARTPSRPMATLADNAARAPSRPMPALADNAARAPSRPMPALADNAAQSPSKPIAAAPARKFSKKEHVARIRTPRPYQGPPLYDDTRGTFDFLPMIGRTIMGANPFWND